MIACPELDRFDFLFNLYTVMEVKQSSTVGIYYSKSFIGLHISNKVTFRTPIGGSFVSEVFLPGHKVSLLQVQSEYIRLLIVPPL